MPTYQTQLGRPRKAELRMVLFLFFAAGFFLFQLPGLAQEQEEGEFKGAGIHLRLRGAWTMFSGGDLKNGVQGMYDQTAAKILDMGYETVSSDEEKLNSGTEITGDVIYYFTPRLGVGLGGGWLWARRDSIFRFRPPDAVLNYMMTSSPKLDVTSVRLGVFYTLPLGRVLAVTLNAGPAYYFADFQYGKSTQIPIYVDSMILKGKANDLGLEGGIGLLIRMNRRLDFVIEAQGRLAKVSGFDGKQQLYRVIEGVPVIDSVAEGPLSYVERDGLPRLEIFPDGSPPGLSVKDAALDLSGVSFQAGLNFKF